DEYLKLKPAPPLESIVPGEGGIPILNPPVQFNNNPKVELVSILNIHQLLFGSGQSIFVYFAMAEHQKKYLTRSSTR
ncbi:MAG: hypothetical protein KJ985_06365, partial [Proteobacteria bacterium]|nr:hypothetical protein [Pseudomonadota bacterium]